jgi:hypothetical protein
VRERERKHIRTGVELNKFHRDDYRYNFVKMKQCSKGIDSIERKDDALMNRKNSSLNPIFDSLS